MFNRLDIPLSGLIEQKGHTYLFWCLAGAGIDSNIWAYSLLQDDEVARLQDDDQYDEAFDDLTLRADTVAFAIRGHIVVATSMTGSAFANEEQLIRASFDALNVVVSEIVKRTQLLERQDTLTPLQPQLRTLRNDESSTKDGEPVLQQVS